ncbi:MAG: hypothetical protein U0800_10605 [Isosphaeraceae bacterium]
MSVPQIPQHGPLPDAIAHLQAATERTANLPSGPVGQFVNRREPKPTRNDIAMAPDPVVAGVEAVFEEARPLEGLVAGKPGPRTPEGKAISAQNARSHGCCAGTKNAVEQAEFEGLYRGLVDEYAPESPEECFTVGQLAEAQFRYNKCRRAIQANAIHAVDRYKAERRRPLEDRLKVLEASLVLWEDASTRSFNTGFGYGKAFFEILLKDIDPSSGVKNLRSPDARVFSYLHERCLADEEQGELLRKYRRGADRGNADEFRAYQRAEEKLRDEYYKLSGWVAGRVRELRCEHEKLRRDLAHLEAQPVHSDLQEMLSEGYRKLGRYQKEAELSIHRHRKALEGIRGRMMTSYDRQMGHIRKKHPVMFMVGPLGIHLPDQLSRLCPYDQIDAMVRILLREQRYYDRNARNESREAAARSKPYEAELISDVCWDGVDSDGKGGKRIIGGEKSLMPAPGAPRSPDEPDSPR